jgi:hypothetical protein
VVVLNEVIWEIFWKVFKRSCGLPTRSVGPTNRSAGLLVGRTLLSGMVVSLVGGDPGVPMSHISFEQYLDERDSLRKRRFDQMVEARITWINGSTFPAAQLPQPSFRSDPRLSVF